MNNYIDTESEYEDLTIGAEGLHEEYGYVVFLRWIDQEELTAVVENKDGEQLQVYVEECVFC